MTHENKKQKRQTIRVHNDTILTAKSWREEGKKHYKLMLHSDRRVLRLKIVPPNGMPPIWDE